MVQLSTLGIREPQMIFSRILFGGVKRRGEFWSGGDGGAVCRSSEQPIGFWTSMIRTVASFRSGVGWSEL